MLPSRPSPQFTLNMRRRQKVERELKACLIAMQKDLRCTVCRGLFKDPQTLPCSHSFCLRCIKRIQKSNGSFKCPQCRRELSRRQFAADTVLTDIVTVFQHFWDSIKDDISLLSLTQNTQAYENVVPSHLQAHKSFERLLASRQSTVVNIDETHSDEAMDGSKVDNGLTDMINDSTMDGMLFSLDPYQLGIDEDDDNLNQTDIPMPDTTPPIKESSSDNESSSEEDQSKPKRKRDKEEIDEASPTNIEDDINSLHIDESSSKEHDQIDTAMLSSQFPIDDNQSTPPYRAKGMKRSHSDAIASDIHSDEDDHNDDDAIQFSESESPPPPDILHSAKSKKEKRKNRRERRERPPKKRRKSLARSRRAIHRSETISMAVNSNTEDSSAGADTQSSLPTIDDSKGALPPPPLADAAMNVTSSAIPETREMTSNSDTNEGNIASDDETSTKEGRQSDLDQSAPQPKQSKRNRSQKQKSRRAADELVGVPLTRNDLTKGDYCEVCLDDVEDTFIWCDGCDTCVHQQCYGIQTIPPKDVQWFCDVCRVDRTLIPENKIECCVCKTSGDTAYKPVSISNRDDEDTMRWIHVSCAIWVTGPTFHNVDTMAPVDNIGDINPAQYRLRCIFCKKSGGACLQCEVCKKHSYHVPCAHRGTALLEYRQSTDRPEEVYYHNFCPLHTDAKSRASVPDNNHNPNQWRKNKKKSKRKNRDNEAEGAVPTEEEEKEEEEPKEETPEETPEQEQEEEEPEESEPVSRRSRKRRASVAATQHTPTRRRTNRNASRRRSYAGGATQPSMRRNQPTRSRSRKSKMESPDLEDFDPLNNDYHSPQPKSTKSAFASPPLHGVDVRKKTIAEIRNIKKGPIIIYSKLWQDQESTLNDEFSKIFADRVTISSSWQNSVTHIITQATVAGDGKKEKPAQIPARTIKYFTGVAAGAWVVCFDWIEACLDAGELVDESKYEVLADPKAKRGAQKSRIARQNKTDNGLFNGLTVAVSHEFETDSTLPDKLRTIFRLGGATLKNVLPYAWLKITDERERQRTKRDHNWLFIWDSQHFEMSEKQIQLCTDFDIPAYDYKRVFDALSAYQPLIPLK